jgi:hypothetical protein
MESIELQELDAGIEISRGIRAIGSSSGRLVATRRRCEVVEIKVGNV